MSGRYRLIHWIQIICGLRKKLDAFAYFQLVATSVIKQNRDQVQPASSFEKLNI